MSKKLLNFLILLAIYVITALILAIPVVRLILFVIIAGIIGIIIIITGFKKLLEFKLIKSFLLFTIGIGLIFGLILLCIEWF